MGNAQEVHFIGRVAQKALIVQEGKALLVRSVGEERYALPGGRLNEGEEPISGLRREVTEEIGCEIVLERPFSTGQWVSPNGDAHFLVVYLAHLPSGSELVADAAEIAEIRWFGKTEIDDANIYPAYRSVLKEYFSAVN